MQKKLWYRFTLALFVVGADLYFAYQTIAIVAKVDWAFVIVLGYLWLMEFLRDAGHLTKSLLAIEGAA